MQFSDISSQTTVALRWPRCTWLYLVSSCELHSAPKWVVRLELQNAMDVVCSDPVAYPVWQQDDEPNTHNTHVMLQDNHPLDQDYFVSSGTLFLFLLN